MTSRNGTSDLQSNPFISPSADRSEPSEIGVNTEELAIAALPLSLFFHDSEIKLQQALESLLSPSQQEAQPAILAVSFAIARLLQEQTEPLTLVLQTVNFLKRIIPQTAISQGLIHQLEQVQQCLVGQVSLQTAITKILPLLGPGSVETGAIALAFYCILSTPEHFSLALLRAVQVSDRPVTIAALTGALAGAHNSVHGIPLEWQIILNDSTELAVWGMSGVQLEELATRLLINWSGVYDAANVGAIPPIAAPGVIRPR